MFQHASLIKLTCPVFLPGSLLHVPFIIGPVASCGLCILEIHGILEKHSKIPRLMDIEQNGLKRPYPMIHPDSGNAVSIGNKFTRPAANDGCIASVHPHARNIIHQKVSHLPWIHNKKGQAILPQISPSSSSTTVIMMRQEGTSVDGTKERLKADPLQEVVIGFISCMEIHICPLLPPFFCLFKSQNRLLFAVIFFTDERQIFFLFCDSHPDNVACRLARS